MHRGLKATNVFFSKLSLNIIVNFIDWNLTDSGKIFETVILICCLNLVQISCRLLSLFQNHSRKSVIVYVNRQIYASKGNGHFLETKINLMHSFNLHIFWWMYKVYVAGQFLWIVQKSSRRFLCSKYLNLHKWDIENQIYARVMPDFNSLHNVFPG